MKIIEGLKSLTRFLNFCKFAYQSSDQKNLIHISKYIFSIANRIQPRFHVTIQAVKIELKLSVFHCIDFPRLLICIFKALCYFRTEEKTSVAISDRSISTLTGL